MENLWEKMIAMFGHKWASTYGPTDSGDTWRKVLTGITSRQLADGLNHLATHGDAWPPSAPEFRKMCLNARNDELGLPAPEIALIEAMTNSTRPGQHKWTHAAIYIAGRATGWHELKTGTEENKGLVERFKRNYEIASKRAINGEDLDADIPLGLEDTQDKPRQPTEKDRQAGAAALAALKGTI